SFEADMSDRKKTIRNGAGQQDRWLHAGMGALGALVVAGMLGVFAYEALREGPAAPQVTLRIEAIEPAGEAWLVRGRADNAGKQTAAELTVEGRLANGETSAFTLDFLPDGSTRAGGLMFRTRPAAENLSLRVVGYREP